MPNCKTLSVTIAVRYKCILSSYNNASVFRLDIFYSLSQVKWYRLTDADETSTSVMRQGPASLLELRESKTARGSTMRRQTTFLRNSLRSSFYPDDPDSCYVLCRWQADRWLKARQLPESPRNDIEHWYCTRLNNSVTDIATTCPVRC